MARIGRASGIRGRYVERFELSWQGYAIHRVDVESFQPHSQGSATNDVPCSQSLTAEHHSSLAANAIQAGNALQLNSQGCWGMHFERGLFRRFLALICGRNCALWIRWAVSIASRLIGFDGIGSTVPISLASSPPNPIATPPPCNTAGPVRSLRSLRPS